MALSPVSAECLAGRGMVDREPSVGTFYPLWVHTSVKAFEDFSWAERVVRPIHSAAKRSPETVFSSAGRGLQGVGGQEPHQKKEMQHH